MIIKILYLAVLIATLQQLSQPKWLILSCCNKFYLIILGIYCIMYQLSYKNFGHFESYIIIRQCTGFLVPHRFCLLDSTVQHYSTLKNLCVRGAKMIFLFKKTSNTQKFQVLFVFVQIYKPYKSSYKATILSTNKQIEILTAAA